MIGDGLPEFNCNVFDEFVCVPESTKLLATVRFVTDRFVNVPVDALTDVVLVVTALIVVALSVATLPVTEINDVEFIFVPLTVVAFTVGAVNVLFATR